MTNQPNYVGTDAFVFHFLQRENNDVTGEAVMVGMWRHQALMRAFS